MTPQLASRLAAARAEALVGRAAERSVLEAMLSGAADAPVVAYVHGPGGIGKSSLLRHAAHRAELAGRRAVRLDGRHLDAQPRRFERAAVPACHEPGAVLLVDSFEQSQPLEQWLRDAFLPRLADDAVVVLASRIAPDPEWFLDAGWAPLFAELAVRPLGVADSHALLAARGVADAQRDALVGFAGGSPLALSLAATVVAGGSDDVGTWSPTADVLTTLVDRLVGEVPSGAHRRALEVVAQARVTREPLLRTVLGEEVTASAFPWLRQLPYIEVTPEGLHPHDAVRATLAADLRWRDPERFADVHAEVSRAALQAVRTAGEDDAQSAVVDWLFLHRDQRGMGDVFDGQAHPHVEDTPLSPQDVPDVLRMEAEAQGATSAEVAAHWLRRQPEAFRVYRHLGTSAPVAFMAIFQLEGPLAEDRAADPALDAIWEHVDAGGPLAPGEHVAVFRYCTQPGWREGPSPVMTLVTRRAFAHAVRATGRAATYSVVTDAERWGGFLTDWGLQLVAQVPVGESVQHVYVQPGGGWVQGRVHAPVPAPREPVPPHVEDLPREVFDEGVLEALRTWRVPREFATSVLLRSRLVPSGSADPVSDLRRAFVAALDALQVDPAGVRAHEALDATYLSASRTHKAAARRLGVPYGTYRRHLVQAKERLVAQLWKQVGEGAAPTRESSAG
ncbi:ATP-binding protein [Kineococcus glutinatus]|uniref:ATP-binding protein n=1 Tax=Kineococcus glutinatus TaxID=1070872 RepID=A0ABP9HMZ9_9ACTN